MNAVILVAMLVIVAMVLACWVVIVRLMVKKEISSPYQIYELQQAGHPIARLYFRFFYVALIALAVVCVAAMLRA